MDEKEFTKKLLEEDDEMKKTYKEMLKTQWELEIETNKQRTFEMKRKLEDFLEMNEKRTKNTREEF